jgi:hypothetical protein
MRTVSRYMRYSAAGIERLRFDNDDELSALGFAQDGNGVPLTIALRLVNLWNQRAANSPHRYHYWLEL